MNSCLQKRDILKTNYIHSMTSKCFSICFPTSNTSKNDNPLQFTTVEYNYLKTTSLTLGFIYREKLEFVPMQKNLLTCITIAKSVNINYYYIVNFIASIADELSIVKSLIKLQQPEK